MFCVFILGSIVDDKLGIVGLFVERLIGFFDLLLIFILKFLIVFEFLYKVCKIVLMLKVLFLFIGFWEIVWMVLNEDFMLSLFELRE